MIELDLALKIWSDELIRTIPSIPEIQVTYELPSIYFVGKAGSGKSYNANFLIKKYGYYVAKFAYPIYMIAEKYLGMKEKDRKLLQILGTDIGRETINQDIWVNRFKEDMTIVQRTVKLACAKPLRFVMDDCRFPNEHKVLKELGFVGIYLDVPEDLRKSRLIGRDGSAQEDTLNHKSETYVDSFKDELIRLDASGNLEDNYLKLNALLETLINR